MTNPCCKCLIVLQKQLQIRLYHYVLTTLEILFPIIFTILPLYIKGFVEAIFVAFGTSIFLPQGFSSEADVMPTGINLSSTAILVPDNMYTQWLTNDWVQLRITNLTLYRMGAKLFEAGHYNIIPDIIIEFQNEFPSNNIDFSQDLRYCIHANAKSQTWPVVAVAVQHFIALNFMNGVKGQTISSDIKFMRESFPIRDVEPLTLIKRIGFDLYTRLGIPLFFIFLIPVLVTQIVMEKQSGIKELMRLMGLPVSIQWLGFFFNAFVVTFVSVLTISLLLTQLEFTYNVDSIRDLIPGMQSATDQSPGGNNQYPGGNDQYPGGNNHYPGGNDQNPGGNNRYPRGNDQYPGGSNQYPGNDQYPGGNNQYPGGNNQYPGGPKHEKYYTSPPLLGKTSWLHVFIVLILYVLSSISFCLFLSSLFATAIKATLYGLLLWLLTYLVPLWMTPAGSVGALTSYEMLLWALLPNMALIWCLRFMGFQELQDGLKWSHYYKSPTLAEDICFLPLLVMFVVDILLYWYLGWYIDALFPGKYGIPRPWYFQCTDISNRCRSAQNYDEESLSSPAEEQPNRCQRFLSVCIDKIERKLHVTIVPVPPPTSEFSASADHFELEPTDLPEIIVARNLTKTFRPGCFAAPFYAVHNVNLTVYKGEIFVLLGHNGAGKTVTLSMLTGIFAPTRGSVTISGYNIRTHLSKARDLAGFCPQESITFTELTVRQHLNFFGKLKGLKGKRLKAEVNDLLTKLKIWDKRHTRCKKLSGGMLRRLQFAIAIIGHIQLLVLDEPSSGLDPESRRIIWDMALQLRDKCCILLTTHHMEEADALADRIAIMSQGKIVCCGSPMFLRKMFGGDYIMKISKGVGCNAQEVLGFVKRFVPEATIEKESHTEISIKLPAKYKGSFSGLFGELENRLEELNIASFGLGTLSLDDVFIKVNEMVQSTDKSTENKEASIAKGHLETSQGCGLCCHRLLGLMMKRIYYIYHRALLFSITAIFAFIAVILVIYIFSKKKTDFTKDEWFESPFETPRMVVFEFHDTNVHCLPEAYIKNIPKNVTVVEAKDGMHKTIMEFAQRDLLAYEYGHYPMGASFESPQKGTIRAKAWHTNSLSDNTSKVEAKKFYRIIASLNLVHNAVLQGCQEHRKIMLKLHVDTTLPRPSSSAADNKAEEEDKSFKYILTAMLLTLGLCLITCNFVLFLVQEKTNEFKHLQIITGVGSIYFNLAAFLFDFLFYFVHICCIIILLVIFAGDIFFDSSRVAGYTFLTLLLFGWTAIPFQYFLCLCFKSPVVAYVTLLVIHLGSIVILSLIRLSLAIANHPILRHLCIIFDCFPGSAATSSFNAIWLEHWQASSSMEYKTPINLRDQMESVLLVMFLSGLAYMLLVLLLDCRFPSCAGFTMRKEKLASGEEPDVEAETKRIKSQLFRQKRIRQSGGSDNRSNSVRDDSLIVYNLTKTFGRKIVVDHLTFGVHEDECFGLLGINGAGKTTAFRILTGSLKMKSGNAYLLGISLKNGPMKFLSKIGYCPQFHTHIDQLTCRETLLTLARLRGIKGKLKSIVDAYINQFSLGEHASKQTSMCSLGTKRKLSAALAFLGSPDAVLLDEPTTGVDPSSKRNVWDMISASKSKGTCVILSSHSMDECEVLCSRLAIMKKGKFRCIGSGQYLKSKFGKGFNVSVKLAKAYDPFRKEQNRDDVVNYMENQFKNCIITDEHEGLLEYSVPYSSADWKKLFAAMEEATAKFHLDDYSVCQTTLDQIFLAFASDAEQ